MGFLSVWLGIALIVDVAALTGLQIVSMVTAAGGIAAMQLYVLAYSNGLRLSLINWSDLQMADYAAILCRTYVTMVYSLTQLNSSFTRTGLPPHC